MAERGKGERQLRDGSGNQDSDSNDWTDNPRFKEVLLDVIALASASALHIDFIDFDR